MMNQRNPDEFQRQLAAFFHSFRQECQNLTENVGNQLQQSLQQQRQEMSHIAQESINDGLDDVISRYHNRLDKADNSLHFRTQQLERTMDELNRKNQQLIMRSWLSATICLATLLISSVYLLYHYKSEISANQSTAELTKLINRSDLTICGDRLCAAVSGQKQGKYRVVNQR